MADQYWSTADLDALKRMLAEGHSFTDIGLALGRSRNAIAGAADRMKLRGAPKSRKVAAIKPSARPTSPTVRSAPRPPMWPTVRSAPLPPQAPLPGEPSPIGPQNDFPPRGGCQWVFGDPNTNTSWRMCGHPGKPYCEFHVGQASAGK